MDDDYWNCECRYVEKRTENEDVRVISNEFNKLLFKQCPKCKRPMQLKSDDKLLV